MFIKLTQVEGGLETNIRVDSITNIDKLQYGPVPTNYKTLVCFDHNSRWVEETPEEVLEKIIRIKGE